MKRMLCLLLAGLMLLAAAACTEGQIPHAETPAEPKGNEPIEVTAEPEPVEEHPTEEPVEGMLLLSAFACTGIPTAEPAPEPKGDPVAEQPTETPEEITIEAPEESS